MTTETSGQFTSPTIDLDEAIGVIEAAFQAELEKLASPQRERLAEIIALTDSFWANPKGPLESQYRMYCRMMAAECYQLFPSFLTPKLKSKTWAAAILWAIVTVNRLFEPFPQPDLNAWEVAEAFGVSLRTLQSKSHMIIKRRLRARISQL